MEGLSMFYGSVYGYIINRGVVGGFKLLQSVEVFGGEVLVEGWRCWKGSADCNRLLFVGHVEASKTF